MLDEERGQVVVAVDDRNHESAEALGIDVDVRPGRQQRSRRVHRPLPRRKHQRREAASREGGVERLQRQPGDPVPLRFRRQHLGAGVHVGALLDQHLHDRAMVFGRGRHERRLSQPPVCPVDIRAPGKKQPHRFGAPRARGQYQNGFALRPGLVRVVPASSSTWTIAGSPFSAASANGVTP